MLLSSVVLGSGQAIAVSRSPVYVGWAIGCIAFDRLTCEGLQGGLSGAGSRGLTFQGPCLFCGLDCCEIVFVCGRLGEDLMELCSSCCDVGYVRDGFPDEVG